MSSPLVALPTELLEYIVLELPTTSDLCSLRAACHGLEAKTFNVFGRLYFSSRRHMIFRTEGYFRDRPTHRTLP
ncbi:uncharacterized protein K441DRAFT_657916 [Cenococcum geophilum 1.58]|uniref:uncharacterized protein n=1 Tax=Cenococcum geophilum 1.58 TaxID=794803 RepID=UPI00358F0C6C|nr:hypothetical protein K441DRAFT_657916 [Cenococcum geophilum 1.58]